MKKILLSLLTVGFLFATLNGASAMICTMEAKLCSDKKTYVSRTGPNCEFAKCPSTPLPRECTMEAKLCSDKKTYVSRTGPNCEFTACPVVKKANVNMTKANRLISLIEKRLNKAHMSKRGIIKERVIANLEKAVKKYPKHREMLEYVIDNI